MGANAFSLLAMRHALNTKPGARNAEFQAPNLLVLSREKWNILSSDYIGMIAPDSLIYSIVVIRIM